MLVYEGNKTTFIDDVDLNVISDKIYEKYQQFFGRTNESQINSWKNSMQYMRGVLSDQEIPNDAGIAIEFNIPATSKRIDFIISGLDNNQKDSVVIVELKQWQECKAVNNKDGIVETYTGHAYREVAHPSYQALSYAQLIRDFNQTVQEDDINVIPCAFLHNYYLNDNDPICSDQFKEYIDLAPLFGHDDVKKLREFIKKYVKYGDNKNILYRIENGRLRPSKMLQDSLSKMLEGNKEFYMIDEQKVIFEEAKLLAKQAIENNKKITYVIEGGPGTGKTVVAINLLVELMNNEYTSFYVTKNTAPRSVFEEKLRGSYRKTYINHLFKGSGSFIDAKRNSINCLIVDESHRLTDKSGIFRNKGENQIKEIINASNISIFFIDESQKVTSQDIGTIDEIKKYADELGSEYHIDYLASQFRCNGSDGYLAWLDNILDIKKTANFEFDAEEFNYEFKVFDNPNELFNAIKEKNNINNKSRVVAGYCWEWISEGKNNSDIFDINIDKYNFHKSWNLGNTSTWAIDEESINEIGCIHTCQGLEFDYVGVIIGDDLRYENNAVITDYEKRAKTDQSLKVIKTKARKGDYKAQKECDSIIRNTYRTLMTRGMKGCYVYCTNKELSEYFRNNIN